MSDDVQVTKVLDLKGLACPMPVVKVSKGIKEVRSIDRFSGLGQNQRQRNREDRAGRQADYVLHQTAIVNAQSA
jgi:hypothetical protein